MKGKGSLVNFSECEWKQVGLLLSHKCYRVAQLLCVRCHQQRRCHKSDVATEASTRCFICTWPGDLIDQETRGLALPRLDRCL